MFTHKINFSKQKENLQFLRSVAKHFGDRPRKIEGTLLFFNKDKWSDENLFAEFGLLEHIQENK